MAYIFTEYKRNILKPKCLLTPCFSWCFIAVWGRNNRASGSFSISNGGSPQDGDLSSSSKSAARYDSRVPLLGRNLRTVGNWWLWPALEYKWKRRMQTGAEKLWTTTRTVCCESGVRSGRSGSREVAPGQGNLAGDDSPQGAWCAGAEVGKAQTGRLSQHQEMQREHFAWSGNLMSEYRVTMVFK